MENLNTVLDDNKLLCLSNGQRIKLPADLRIIFEADDLKNCTPASISRCGIVYMDKDTMGIRNVADNWLLHVKDHGNIKYIIVLKINENETNPTKSMLFSEFTYLTSTITHFFSDSFFTLKQAFIPHSTLSDLTFLSSFFNNVLQNYK
jgi:hypothetical protein